MNTSQTVPGVCFDQSAADAAIAQLDLIVSAIKNMDLSCWTDFVEFLWKIDRPNELFHFAQEELTTYNSDFYEIYIHYFAITSLEPIDKFRTALTVVATDERVIDCLDVFLENDGIFDEFSYVFREEEISESIGPSILSLITRMGRLSASNKEILDGFLRDIAATIQPRWDVEPQSQHRSGIIGLRNFGEIYYLNSISQQFLDLPVFQARPLEAAFPEGSASRMRNRCIL